MRVGTPAAAASAVVLLGLGTAWATHSTDGSHRTVAGRGAVVAAVSPAHSSAAVSAPPPPAAAAPRITAHQRTPAGPPSSTAQRPPVVPSPPQVPAHPASTHRAVTRAPSGLPPSGIAKALFDEINSERAGNGLPTLPWSSSLAAIASQHTGRMAAANVLAHQVGSEADAQVRARSAGFPNGMAENIAMNGIGTMAGAMQVHRMLYAEKAPHDPHRRNILSRSAHALGIGVVIDAEGQVWLTEDFGW
ncbi:MAG: hypothetical protein QOE97_971 [Pseudonocardiales bacterium]|jgi:uncharacterized protein YkwD|nr:hypothetical protein [Pseudonocardiales bacterium]